MSTNTNLNQLNKILAELPSYAEVTVEMTGIKEPQRLMARDLPGPERRFTNLTSGSEWFLPFTENIGVEAVHIPEQTWKVGY